MKVSDYPVHVCESESDSNQVLEAQSAHLTNYEVLGHLESMRTRYDAPIHQGARPEMKSGNLETVMKEVHCLRSTTVVQHLTCPGS